MPGRPRRSSLTLSVLALAAGCSALHRPSSDALVLDLPPVRQQPARCGPSALQAVYRYWGGAETGAEVVARVFSFQAAGTLPGMLVADARRNGWRAAMGPAEPAHWADALAARVPVICLLEGPAGGHFVVLQGHDHGRFLVNDGAGRLRWAAGRAVGRRRPVLSIYVWPPDYGFDPPPGVVHDARPCGSTS
jgi:hypothetical protein